VNYLEHYGLLRQRVSHGDRVRYERVDASHSWNSNNVATNVLLYHLQRHSDHHANPTRRYQALRDEPTAPVLPTGYAGMILLALVAAGWGVAVGLSTARTLVHPAMLAIAGSSVFLASVLVAGFGYGYKATFLLLTVPLVSALVRSSRSVIASSSILILILTGITAIVVWNTVLATFAGVIVASFALGLSGALLVRCIRPAARVAA
jgi:hypothetical protein